MAENLLERLRDDLPFFAANCLKIRTKDERIIPLSFNRAQRIVHEAMEKQKREKGWVRILILKGRQFGISTYIAARFYHRASLRQAINTFILSHERPSSNALFGLVDRFQTYNPLAPHVDTDNVNELVFDLLDSSYVVATAGGKPSGRSRTLSLFHGSEAAMWANAPAHFAASVQAVPLLPNTEIALETTSNGPVGEFYEHWQDAMAGRGDYIALFLPWSLDDDYQRVPPADFELSTEKASDEELSEAEYAALHGLSLAQMCWRRNKILELRSELTFRREYPMTVEEAFSHGKEYAPFISPTLVLKARKRHLEGTGPLVFGVDPASLGGDRFSIAARRGAKVEWVRFRNKIDTLEGTQWVKSLIDEFEPARVNIDAGGIGQAIVTNVKALGPRYAEVVRGINFGGTSQFKFAKPHVPGPFNRRAEMWDRLREWLELPEGADIPDDAALQSDICAATQKARLNHDWGLESKEDMRARGVKSPDLADAVALTFASLEFFPRYKDAKPKMSFGNIDVAKRTTTYDVGAASPNGWMGF